MYIGDESILVGGKQIALSVNDFWRWAYSDLSNKPNRMAFAEFIVASSLDEASVLRQANKSCDILWSFGNGGIRINVKAGAYIESPEREHPNRIKFTLSEHDDPRSSDVLVFCIFKAMSQDASPLDMDLWDFYTIRSNALCEKLPDRKGITLPALMDLAPIWSDYYGIGMAIKKAMTVQ